MNGPIPQWKVQPPGAGARVRVFENPCLALSAALNDASPAEPAVVTTPDGERFVVFRVSEQTELSTRSVYGSTVRRVVEL